MLKPQHIACVHELKHNGCLCKLCENFKLLFESLRKMIIANLKETILKVPDLIDSFLCGECLNCKDCDICNGNLELIREMFQEGSPEVSIELTQWQQDGFQLKLITSRNSHRDIIDMLLDFLDYKLHIDIKKAQSSYFHQCIMTPSDEVAIVQIDFAENFKCISQNEVQSAYYNQHVVAILTVVIWIGDIRISKIFVMDDRSHSKFCVFLCLQLIIKDLKEKYPNVNLVKMFSDGCAGQFKNRWTLSNIVFAQELFGLDMTWDFFASGHGKGAVDGVGGTAKRAVYQRIMSGQVHVYSANDFHKCIEDNLTGIISTLITEDQIRIAEASISQKWKNIKAIPAVTKFFSFKRGGAKMIEASETALNIESKRFKIV